MRGVHHWLQTLHHNTKTRTRSQVATGSGFALLCERNEVADMKNRSSDTVSGKASEIIKQKLKESGGCATVSSLRGKTYEIRLKDNDYFLCPLLKPYDFSVFDMIVDLLVSQKQGRADKGNARSLPLGAKGCEEWTVAGTVLKKYFGRNIGEYGPDPIPVFSAVLDWAGIVYNRRGYLELTPAYQYG